MRAKNALAIVNMLLFVFILSILSGIVLAVATSNTKAIESHIRRTKAQYLAEAGNVYQIDASYRGVGLPGPRPVVWTYDINGVARNKTVYFSSCTTAIIGSPLNYTTFVELNSSVDYTF